MRTPRQAPGGLTLTTLTALQKKSIRSAFADAGCTKTAANTLIRAWPWIFQLAHERYESRQARLQTFRPLSLGPRDRERRANRFKRAVAPLEHARKDVAKALTIVGQQAGARFAREAHRATAALSSALIYVELQIEVCRETRGLGKQGRTAARLREECFGEELAFYFRVAQLPQEWKPSALFPRVAKIALGRPAMDRETIKKYIKGRLEPWELHHHTEAGWLPLTAYATYQPPSSKTAP